MTDFCPKGLRIDKTVQSREQRTVEFKTNGILLKIFIYLAVPGLCGGTWDLLSSLWHAGFFVAACGT